MKIRHLSRVKDDISLTKTEEKDNQLLIEKIIGAIKKNNPYVISMGKKSPEIMLEIEKNYILCKRVYQSLFLDIADLFIQYIHSLESDQIKRLDDDRKANG